MILIGIITFTSCSDDFSEIETTKLNQVSDPDDDDNDCKSNCPGG